MPELTSERIEIIPIRGIPFIRPGANLGRLILDAAKNQDLPLRDGDIIVCCSKVLARAEGRIVPLADVTPGSLAVRFAQSTGKDPRVVQVVLDHSRRILRMDRGLMIVESTQGLVGANAGIDLSNVDGGQSVCLLPEDGDRSAALLKAAIEKDGAVEVAVIVTDSVGRPWRVGLVDVAVGLAGMSPIIDCTGEQDLTGLELEHTQHAVADALAAAAGLWFRKASAIPVCVVRGFAFEPQERASIKALARDPEADRFR